MEFIQVIQPGQAKGLLQEEYEAAEKAMGYVPNYVKAFSLHPEVYDAWTKLISAVRSSMRLRRYELVTFASAMELECTYCMLAHGSLLRKNFFTAEELINIVKDFRNAGLTTEEVAVMEFAMKITRKASQVDETDISELRNFGLTDTEILNVVLASTARNFFSKTLDTLAIPPDEAFQNLEPELIEALTIGRPYRIETVV
jgi:uncharacterized peroxidase-related enzyme